MIFETQVKTSAGAFFRPCLPLLLLCLGLSACQHHPAGMNLESVSRESGEHYAGMFGQRYRTKTDLYLFIIHEDFDYKYLAKRDSRLPELPADVSKAHIGYTYGDFLILDVVPAGSVLTLAAETHELTGLSGLRAKGGIPMGFICKLAYNGREQDGVFSEFIQLARPAPPGTLNQEINPEFAERLNP